MHYNCCIGLWKHEEQQCCNETCDSMNQNGEIIGVDFRLDSKSQRLCESCAAIFQLWTDSVIRKSTLDEYLEER